MPTLTAEEREARKIRVAAARGRRQAEKMAMGHTGVVQSINAMGEARRQAEEKKQRLAETKRLRKEEEERRTKLATSKFAKQTLKSVTAAYEDYKISDGDYTKMKKCLRKFTVKKAP